MKGGNYQKKRSEDIRHTTGDLYVPCRIEEHGLQQIGNKAGEGLTV